MVRNIINSLMFWCGLEKTVDLGFCSLVDASTVFEGYNHIGKFVSFKSSYIGFGSYIGNNCRLSHVKIGRFSSIADRVYLITGSHPTNQCISTHPAFYSPSTMSGLSYQKELLFRETKYAEYPYSIVIGSDVWIGSDVKILQGITIGNGAIVACGAVVTKDVKPYTIVGGVPAHVIGKRFSEEQIMKLLKIQWWNRSQTWLQDNANLFNDPYSFFNKVNF